MKNQFSILIADDEEAQREVLSGFLSKKGFDIYTASSVNDAMEVISENVIDMVLTDFRMGDGTGLDLLKMIKALIPSIHVVVMTAYGSIDDAVQIMKSGAYHYIQKPIELSELLHIIGNAKEHSMLVSENQMLRKELSEKYAFGSIISNSPEMENILNTAARVAASKASVMIRGESGVGKELIAKAVHYAGDRKDKPFVVVNCAAMPDTLFESELFGHEKGAFTGAAKQRLGKFESADGGTLFIDELGDIPLQIQVKLLRAIQFGEFERLGGNKTIKVDVRIITATNRNLEDMIKSGEFREDLYYRFNVVTILIPPLRDRKADIPALITHFISKYSDLNGKALKGISREALDSMMKYDYPGNIRELENIIQRAVVLSRDEYITISDLPKNVSIGIKDNSLPDDIEIGDLNIIVESIERKLIKKALNQCFGNQSKAAELLNISERTIRYKISKYNIKQGEE